MTFIEFFDREPVENVVTCLTLVPDRVILIGDQSKLIHRHISRYEKVFSARGNGIAFLSKTVSKSNLDHTVSVLSEIVETYEDCVFDITGGDELLLVALGIVVSHYPEKNIQIHRINVRNNAVYDCDKDGATVESEIPKLSVAENVIINGGEVVYGDILDDKTFRWDLNDGFIRDVNAMWEICREDPRLWNVQINTFSAMEEVGTVSEDGLSACAYLPSLKHHLSQNEGRYTRAKGIIDDLLEKGLLTFYDDKDGDTVAVGYKNLQVKKCLTKAGLILELKVYISALNLADLDGIPVYHDGENGVLIDWDGEIHDQEQDNQYDTRNEIDVILMHDAIPVFISCKNGFFTADELYKLNTVTKCFGGKYAKQVLVATNLQNMGETGKYIRQRAEDMQIRLIEDFRDLDDAGIEKKLKNLWRN